MHYFAGKNEYFCGASSGQKIHFFGSQTMAFFCHDESATHCHKSRLGTGGAI